eukprot:6357740-Prymnesium_polylepis.2
MHGLVEGLIGVKKGEVRSITVMFPERTSAPQLAGKEAIFEVWIECSRGRAVGERGCGGGTAGCGTSLASAWMAIYGRPFHLSHVFTGDLPQCSAQGAGRGE